MSLGRPSGFAYVAERELGVRSRFPPLARAQAARSLRCVARNFVYRRATRAWALALDPVDRRFLLVGCAKSRVSLFDLKALDDAAGDGRLDFVSPSSSEASSSTSNSEAKRFDASHALAPEAQASAREPTGQRGELQFGLTSVDWYPVDGGLFATGALDGHVKLWDSDAFAPVSSFALRSRVYCARFSPAASAHALIAAATAKGEVRLCDINVSAAVHSLLGHGDEVWTLAWSPRDEHLLATGARDGEVRLWDVRRSGSTACLLSLNLEGPAVVPGRSSLYADAAKKRGLASSVTSGSTRKRQRTLSATSNSSTSRERAASSNPFRAGARALPSSITRTTMRPRQQRNDPHAAASTSFAVAHRGGVNALAFTPNGHHLLSSGLDQALRLWDCSTGAHQFMNYEHIENDLPSRPIQMAVVQEADAWSSTIVFHPNGRHGELNAYNVFGDHGKPLMRSTAHYEQISACVYRETKQELYSAGEDGLIMRWRPPELQLCPDPSDDEETKPRQREGTVDADNDVDSWSDDEEDTSNAGHQFIPPILR